MKNFPEVKSLLKKRDVTSLVKPIVAASEAKTEKKLEKITEKVDSVRLMVKEMSATIDKIVPKPEPKFDENVIRSGGETYKYDPKSKMFRTTKGRLVARDTQDELREKIKVRNESRKKRLEKATYAKVDFTPVLKVIDDIDGTLEKMMLRDKKQKEKLDDVIDTLKEIKKATKQPKAKIRPFQPKVSERKTETLVDPERFIPEEPVKPTVKPPKIPKALLEQARTDMVNNALEMVVQKNFSAEDAKKFIENYEKFRNKDSHARKTKPGLGLLVTLLTGNESLGKMIDTPKEGKYKTASELKAERLKAREELFDIIKKYHPELVTDIKEETKTKTESKTRQKDSQKSTRPETTKPTQSAPSQSSPLNIGPLDAIGVNTNDPLDDDERVRILSEVMTKALILAFEEPSVKDSLGQLIKENTDGGGGGGLLSGLGSLFGKKGLGKVGAKTLAKKIPVVGLVAGLGFAAGKLMDGDYTGAGLEVASGAASTIPGIGTAASVGIDIANESRNVSPNETVLEGSSAIPSQVKLEDLMVEQTATTSQAGMIDRGSRENETMIQSTERVIVQTDKPVQQTVVVSQPSSSSPINEFPLTPRNFESTYSRLIAEDFVHPAISTSGSF